MSSGSETSATRALVPRALRVQGAPGRDTPAPARDRTRAGVAARLSSRAPKGCRVIVSSKSSEAQLQRLGDASEYQPYPWPAEPTGAEEADCRTSRPSSFSGRCRRSAHVPLPLHPARALPRARPAPVGERRVPNRDRRPWRVPAWASTMLAATPELEHVGFVDDLAGLLASVHAAIAPISVPVGNRSRISTALAAGTVVVAHENAALGNP